MTTRIKKIHNLCSTPFSLVLAFLCLTICFQACKKKPTTTEDTSKQNNVTTAPSPTTAPAPTTTLIIDSNNTNIKITDISKLSALYVSSFPRINKYFIDLDGDSISDISINVTEGWVYGGGLLEGKTIDVETLNNNTYILTDSLCTETAYLNCNPNNPGIQTTENKVYPKPLDYGQTIDVTSGKWKKGLIFLYAYRANLDTSHCYTSWLIGPWYTFNSPKYMAVKCNGKPAWLKLQVGYGPQWNLALFKFALVKY